MIKKKVEWLHKTDKIFGNCGKIGYVNGKPAGYAQYVPSALLPHSMDYESGLPRDDAVLLSCLFIPNKEVRGLGIGTCVL